MKVDIRTVLRQMMAVYNVEVTEIAYPYHQIIKHDYLELREKLAIEVKVNLKIHMSSTRLKNSMMHIA